MIGLRGKRERLPLVVAVAASLAAFFIGIRWGTFVAGGSDSHCYLAQARSLAGGRTDVEEPLARVADWPDAADTLLAAGYLPSPRHPHASAPICPPGLSLTMAPVVEVAVAGRSAAFFVVPILGAVCVWLTFVIGRRFCGAGCGAMSAVLLASSPIFLYQLVQPMSDVPATAWWLLAAVFLGSDFGSDTAPDRSDTSVGWPFAAGVAASAAIVTRPNLVPLAAILAVAAARNGWSALRRFVVGVIPGITAVAAFNLVTFGSPVSTGYGSASDLFSLAHVLPNLGRYLSWLSQAHTPVLALAVLAPFVGVPDTSARHSSTIAWLGLSVTAVTLACYVPYLVFDDWSYSRFLLPALPFLIVLTVSVVIAAIRRVAPRRASFAASLICGAIAALWIANAVNRRAFDLEALERHFEDAGYLIAKDAPSNAAVLTVKYSGSVRFYAHRPTVLWDRIEPAWLDRVVETLERSGYAPFVLVDADEEAAFKDRFRDASVLGALDWPYLARVGVRATLYDPADRARFLRGEPMRTHQYVTHMKRP